VTENSSQAFVSSFNFLQTHKNSLKALQIGLENNAMQFDGDKTSKLYKNFTKAS
jgi:hypothetical protein